MAERRVLIRAAMERLPLRDGVNLDQSAFALEITTYFARVNELPRMRFSRQKNGMVKELEGFLKHAQRLSRQIDAMHLEAQSSLSPKGERHVLAAQDDLRDMICRAAAAIEKAPETPPRPSNHRLAPKQVAEMCAQMFKDMT
jgi:hypothetical protein